MDNQSPIFNSSSRAWWDWLRGGHAFGAAGVLVPERQDVSKIQLFNPEGSKVYVMVYKFIGWANLDTAFDFRRHTKKIGVPLQSIPVNLRMSARTTVVNWNFIEDKEFYGDRFMFVEHCALNGVTQTGGFDAPMFGLEQGTGIVISPTKHSTFHGNLCWVEVPDRV